MFEIRETGLAGCRELIATVREDARGRFVKVFHDQEFTRLGLATDFREEYYSVSHHGVIRGLHFQSPPHDHVKLVVCTAGSVFDVAVDLRRGSPHYGRFASLELSAARGNALYIPKGFAHGFCVTSAEATLVYKVTSVYAPAHDQGIRWDSAGIPWPVAAPRLSERDLALPPLADFSSPFAYETA